MHDGFFHRVISNALDRGVTQFVLVGGDESRREQRHARPGTRWWQLGEPGEGLGATLASRGFEPDSPALFCGDGAVSRLDQAALTTLLAELRAQATPGTRLAIALPGWAHDGDEIDGPLHRARWRAVEISERAQQAGLRMLAPVWAPAVAGIPPSSGRIAEFTERMLYRPGGDMLASHLETVYGVSVTRTRELDLGVYRADRADGSSWIARVSPAIKDVDAVRSDADLLAWLTQTGFPAERPAAPQPVSILDGQGVLVTEFARGRALAAQPPAFELLGRLLGRLHAADADRQPAACRPGGAWHHLLPAGSPAAEGTAIRALLHDARHRVPAGAADQYDTLLAAVDAWDSCADLPHALVHPDFVPRNAIGQPDGEVTIIDWAGAGRGPRIVSLGCLLWSAGPGQNAAAAIAGYRQSIMLEPAEVDRLHAAMRLRPLVLACWMFATGRDSLPNVTDGWNHHLKRIDRVANDARRLIATPFPF